jgi:hypothetical protein
MGRTHASHTPQARADAVRLLEQGTTLAQVASDTGIPMSTLATWRKKEQELSQEALAAYKPSVDPVPTPPGEPVPTNEPTAARLDGIVVPRDDAPIPRAHTQDAHTEDLSIHSVRMTFNVVLDPTGMDELLRKAVGAWLQEATMTHWDTEKASIRLPDPTEVPRRWIVHATPTAMVPEEDA